MNLNLALWYLGRGTGVVTLCLFTATITLGIINRSGRTVPIVGRFGITDLHRSVSLTGAGLLVIHVGTLLLDPYAQLRLVDLVVPFLGTYRPLWLAMGTLALDVLVVLVASSLLRTRIGPVAFRALHWTAYAMWPLAMAHVLGMGTDMRTLWLPLVAAACTVTVLAAVCWRLTDGYAERGLVRLPRRTS
ncbi:MAG: ferric reductase-like transmembrane domain-containing protein [Actinomycetota bacterium]|nr:ferric reductase-like transmembrane domain-containing protein [Actinomycetota bacterium]